MILGNRLLKLYRVVQVHLGLALTHHNEGGLSRGLNVIGAMAEFEKELIRERVQAGLDRRKDELQKRGWFTSKRGNRCMALGRKRVGVDLVQITALREQGHSWRAIASELGVGEDTVRRAVLPRAKNVSGIETGSALVSGAV